MVALQRNTQKNAPPPRLSHRRQYDQASQQPLYCLLFLLPVVATHEFGMLLLRPSLWPERQLVAFSLIQRLLSWIGASGSWLPAAVLLLTLLIWHLLRRHPWRIYGWVFPLMILESLLLTVPLFAMGQVMMQANTAPAVPVLNMREQIVLALGAGIYEELVFRLYLIGGLLHLLKNGLRLPKKISNSVAIALSALLFAGCHFSPIGGEPFAWQHFLMLVLAGAYLALIFLRRGLGVVTGCHVAFNLIPLAWGLAHS